MRHLYAGLLALAFAAAAGRAGAQGIEDIRQLVDSGQVEQAIAALDARITLEPRDSAARFYRGVVLFNAGRIDEARSAFEAMTRDFPALAEPHTNLAVIHAGAGDLVAARDAQLQAVALAPESVAARINLGDIYVRLAADHYRKASELAPDDLHAAARLKVVEQLFTTGG